MNDAIVMNDVWQWTGVRRHPVAARVEDLIGPEAVLPVVIGFWWPTTAVFFWLGLKIVQELETGRNTEYGEDVGHHPVGLEAHRGVEGVLQPGSRVYIELVADTDSHEFRRQAERGGGRPAPVIVPITVTTRPCEWGSETTVIRELKAVIEPAAPMPVLEGFIGVDLGTTSSALAYLSATAVDEAVPIGIDGDPGSIPSAVRVLRYIAARSESALDAADYVVGPGALIPGGESGQTLCIRGEPASAGPEAGWGAEVRGDNGWLVLGAKRLLAGKDDSLTLWLRGERVEVGARLPAELLLASLFRLAHLHLRRVPRQIAVTCPTTSAAWEVQELRQAVLQGWRRSLGATRKEPSRTPEDLPAMVLDEASAAALYLFHRDYLRTPGGLTAFRYLYPAGANLLVYDCGGGSTDVALVRAAVDPTNRDRVHLRVLGRSGLRDFGGDDITAAAARILKAKFAAALGRISGAPRLHLPPFPESLGDGGATAAYLEQFADVIDGLVPTRFDASRLDADGDEARRRAMALWSLAESAKCLLERSPLVSSALDDRHPLVRSLAAVHRMAAGEIAAHLSRVELGRSELDGLVREPLEASVDRANRLIVSRSPDGDVDRVYLVGNSSRYPAVRETIARRLKVAFPDERIDWSPGPDLKMAVSKGAAMALGLAARLSGVRVEFDGGYMNRLPFDVGYADYTIGAVRVLFREWERYDELEPELIPVPTSAGRPEVRMVTLARRWPGEQNFAPYLTFQFPRAVRGPVRVWFAAGMSAPNQFVMRDEMTGFEVVGAEAGADPRGAFRGGF